MSKTSKLYLAAVGALCALGVAACGGNDDRPPAASAPAPAPSPVPVDGYVTLDTAPTAALNVADDAAALVVATDIQSFVEEAAQIARVAGFQSLPTGGTVTYNCAQFLGPGATGTVTYAHPDTAPAVGWKSTIAFNDCQYASGINAFRVGGTLLYEYLRYVSGSDFGFRGSTDGITFTYLQNGTVVRTGTYKFSHTFDLRADGKITSSYATPVSAVGNLAMTRSGSNVTVNTTAVVDLKSQGGIVRLDVTGWTYDLSNGRSSGGTAKMTGSNGARIDVQANATGYTVVFTTAAGVVTTYRYAYPA